MPGRADHRGADSHMVSGTVQDLSGYKADPADKELTFDTFELKRNLFSKLVHEDNERQKAAALEEEVAAAIAQASTRLEGQEGQPTKVDKRTSRIHQFFRPFDIEGVPDMKCILCPPGDNPSDKGVLAVQPSLDRCAKQLHKPCLKMMSRAAKLICARWSTRDTQLLLSWQHQTQLLLVMDRHQSQRRGPLLVLPQCWRRRRVESATKSGTSTTAFARTRTIWVRPTLAVQSTGMEYRWNLKIRLDFACSRGSQ